MLSQKIRRWVETTMRRVRVEFESIESIKYMAQHLETGNIEMAQYTRRVKQAWAVDHEPWLNNKHDRCRRTLHA